MKELLESVYGIKIEKLDHQDKDKIWYTLPGDTLPMFVFVNNFFFDCKEWAYKEHKMLLYSVPDLCIVKSSVLEYIKDFAGDTEQNSVFNACMWLNTL